MFLNFGLLLLRWINSCFKIMVVYENGSALGIVMESLGWEFSSNTARRKRPKEAPGLLVLLRFLA